MEFALKSEIYCFIHLHSLLRIVFVRNIYYIFAKLSLTNIRPRFSNKPIVHSRHRGRYTQKFKNNHFTFLKNTELRLFNRKESQSNSPVQLSSPAVQSNCPVQLSSPTVQSNCPVQSSPCFVLCLIWLLSKWRCINIQSFWGLLAVLLKLTSKSMQSLFRSQIRGIQNWHTIQMIMLTRCKADTCKIMNYVRLLVKPEKTISKHTILRFYFLISWLVCCYTNLFNI